MTQSNSELVRLCWQCNGKLQPGFVEIEFNGSKLAVHKTCQKDAENLLFHDRVTFMGEELEKYDR